MDVSAPEVPPREPAPPPVRRSRWANPLLVLGLMIAAFFVVSLYGGVVAYYNLTIDAAHAYDLSIFQQAFSSTVHGYRVPFYESTDCIVKGRCSFLIVHPSFILYPLTPIYGAFPSPIALFAERSLIVGLAAVPLFWLTRQVTRSDGKALLAAGLFLLWAPTLSGDLYSFHVESFIPIELFTMAALWQAGRYRWGLLAATISFVTIEAAPVFVALIGVFFLSPEIEAAIRAAWRGRKGRRGLGQRLTGAFRDGVASVRGSLRRVDVRYTVALVVVAAVGYVAVNLFMNEFGAGLLGVPNPPEPAGLAGLFYNNSQTGTTGDVSALVGSPGFVVSIEYWLIVYALVAFIPLLNLRSFVIVGLPWMGYTMFNQVHRFSTLSSQYTMLAAIPVFLGVAYGLARVDFRRTIWPRKLRRNRTTPDPGPTGAPTPPTRRRRRVATSWGIVFGVVIAANLVINPMVPLIPDTLGTPHGVFGPYYFEPWDTVQPGFAAVEQLVALIPSSASVAVALNLFPLVANNLYAYRLAANPPNVTGLPFNLSAGPDWVLATPNTVGGGGKPLETYLPNETYYQLRGYVATSTIGPIVLYERGYVGPAELFGPPGPVAAATWTGASGLTVGHFGVRVANSSVAGGYVFETNQSSGKTGPVCGATVGLLPAGSYSLAIDLARLPPIVNISGTARVLQLRLTGFSGLVWESNVTAANLTVSGWTTLDFDFASRTTVVSADFTVQWENPRTPFAVASLQLEPAG
jgi:uncharacterized membrane protein